MLYPEENFGLEFNPSEPELFRAISNQFEKCIASCSIRFEFVLKTWVFNPNQSELGLIRIKAEWSRLSQIDF